MGQVHCSLSCRIKFVTLRVSWWLTSVSWWVCRKYRLVHTIHRPMASVKGSTPSWLICWECYPLRRSQSGRITLEHSSMPITALGTQLQSSAPTISCTGGIPIFQWMLPLVWHLKLWQHQIWPNSYRKWGNMPNGLGKRLKPLKYRKLSATNAIMTNAVGQQPWRLRTWS